MVRILSLDPSRLQELLDMQGRAFVDYPVPVNNSREVFLEFLRSVGGTLTDVLVAEERGELIGYANPVWDAKEGWIGGAAVVPEHRRRGVGTALLQRTIEEARRRGVERLWLEVIVGNEPARRLYERAGFQPTRELLTAEAETLDFGSPTRALVPADLASLRPLHAASYDDACWQKRKAAALEASMRYGAGYRLPGGFVVLRNLNRCCYVSFLGVHPEHRRQGIGRDLLRFAMRKALEAGSYKLSAFNVDAGDPAVQRLLDRFAFSPTLRQREMRLDLPSSEGA